MTSIYRLRASNPPQPADPLHVSSIYRGKQRVHRRKMQDRQDLILYLAKLHAEASKRVSRGARSLVEVPMRLSQLKKWVYDYRVAVDYFFDVKQLGYYVDEDVNSISVLTPKKLQRSVEATTAADLRYIPGLAPDGDFIVSKVHRQTTDLSLLDRLAHQNRFDLIEPVRWLLSQPTTEFNFLFRRAGRLQQRDTSVWPIPAVENWPSWLREELFGPGIDIDSAYTQFLVKELREIYDADQLKRTYPDLLLMLSDKLEWRKQLATVLGLEWGDETEATVKCICMCIANGSTISPAIMTGHRAYSITAEIVVQSATDLSLANLEAIGARLQKISRQYVQAKKAICTMKLRLNPTRTNQKAVFKRYFEWERAARYVIWEAIDRHGIMVHDGIDGVPTEYISRIPALLQSLGLKVTT